VITVYKIEEYYT